VLIASNSLVRETKGIEKRQSCRINIKDKASNGNCRLQISPCDLETVSHYQEMAWFDKTSLFRAFLRFLPFRCWVLITAVDIGKEEVVIENKIG